MTETMTERANREVDALIAESLLPELDAVAAVLLLQAWRKGYEAAAAEHLESLDRIGKKL